MPEQSDKPALLLAKNYTADVDPVGWWMSEKLDGVRAYWNGGKFLSRNGNVLHAPGWFMADLPKNVLDGELYGGRQRFQNTVGIVRRNDGGAAWRSIEYRVFDAPQRGGGFEARMCALDDLFGERRPRFAHLHGSSRCASRDDLAARLAEISDAGGEGIMLRQPGSRYEGNRSETLLKVKRFNDAEAVVIGHQPGRGRHADRLGALTVALPNGTQFALGTGLSDAERDDPPPIGGSITFRYQELTDGGVPRFPFFVRRDPFSAEE